MQCLLKSTCMATLGICARMRLTLFGINNNFFPLQGGPGYFYLVKQCPVTPAKLRNRDELLQYVIHTIDNDNDDTQ